MPVVDLDKLKLISSVKQFCTDYLGIIPNKSYTQITDREKTYYLGISSRDSIKMVSRDSGVIQYNTSAEAYFMRRCYNELLVKEKRFSNTDMYIQEVIASLPHMQDDKDESVQQNPDFYENIQISKGMLELAPAKIISLIIHENVHVHAGLNKTYIWLPIEESIADIIAYQGSKIFAKDDKELLLEVEKFNNLEEEFYRWCNAHTKSLNKMYKEDFLQGRLMLQRYQEEYKTIFPKYTDSINNAFFMMWLPYTLRYEGVKRIIGNSDPRKSIERISGNRRIPSLKLLENIIHS